MSGLSRSASIELSSPPRFAVVGCYGEKNTGDEALLAATLQLLRGISPAADIHVFSDRPEETAAEFGVSSSPSAGFLRPRNFAGMLLRGELWKIFQTVRACDCLILGGGELLRTDYGPRAVFSVFDRVLLAQMLGKPVIMLGVGAGKLPPSWALRILRFSAARAIVLVREDDSVHVLAQAGLPHAKPIPDLAFQLGSKPHSIRLPEGPRVGFSLLAPDNLRVRRFWKSTRADFVSCMASLADHAVALGATPVFVPFSFSSSDDDRAIHREVAAAMKATGSSVVIEEELPAAEVKGVIADMDMVIGMRLHACIFALSEQRPVVALDYDSKVNKVMRSLGVGENVVSFDTPERAHEIMDATWRARGEWRARLQPYFQRDAERLQKNFFELFARG